MQDYLLPEISVIWKYLNFNPSHLKTNGVSTFFIADEILGVHITSVLFV